MRLGWQQWLAHYLTAIAADARIASVAKLQEDARGAGFQALKATQLWRKGEKVCSRF
jgi:hypothetical protein